MRTIRKRNWILRRIVLGFAVMALVIPGASQAARGGTPSWQSDTVSKPAATGTHGAALACAPNCAVEEDQVSDGSSFVPFVTDFPRYDLNSAKVVGIGGPRMHVTGTSEPSVSSTKVVSSGGFDWGDAGIGAAILFGLVLLGGVAFYSSRHLGKAQTA
jgi:hypothetical protein